jgi:hypothetical protein
MELERKVTAHYRFHLFALLVGARITEWTNRGRLILSLFL